MKLLLKIRSDQGIVDVVIYTVDELNEHSVNIILTRRIVLSNVSKIFDPAGFLCPITLMSKLLLRESWKDQALGWDDPLPQEQVTSWLTFFKSLLELNRIQIPRSLAGGGSGWLANADHFL